MKHICKTCGTQYPESDNPPLTCLICTDDRQYIGKQGQQWVSLDLLRSNHRSAFHQPEPNLFTIKTIPAFGIDQVAYLIRTPTGNVLWECVSLLDDAMIDIINGLGGIQVIAFSHPHFFSSMNEWAEVFNANIYIHENDRNWVVYPTDRIHYWSTDKCTINEDVELYCVGGHFDGSTILHWKKGAHHKGVILSGDSMFICPDRRWLTFMHSYPNGIPLPASKVQRIENIVSQIPFDRIYGLWSEQIITENARQAVIQSTQRYLQVLRQT